MSTFTDQLGHCLAVGDRVFKVDRRTGAVLWSTGGTIVGFGRTRIHVKWSGHHYDEKRHADFRDAGC